LLDLKPQGTELNELSYRRTASAADEPAPTVAAVGDRGDWVGVACLEPQGTELNELSYRTDSTKDSNNGFSALTTPLAGVAT